MILFEDRDDGLPAWDDGRSAHDDDLRTWCGELAAHDREFLHRPSADRCPPRALAMLQRAHDAEDRAVCMAIGLGLHPDDPHAEVDRLMAQAQSYERRAILAMRELQERAA